MFIWISVFIVSLIILVKGADWLLASAEKIGLALGLSPFIVGVVIVGIGTSFPEAISSFAAIFQGAPEIVAANAVGSNIANILLVVGISSLIGGSLVVTKNLIDLDLPLIAISTALFTLMAIDGNISQAESVLLIVLFVIYLTYTIAHQKDLENNDLEGDLKVLPSRTERRKFISKLFNKHGSDRPKITAKDIGMLLIGFAGLLLGAKYLVESVINMSQLLNVATGAIALAAVSLGTSLPELMVSVQAARKHKAEVALGNIFGSNVFNVLLVIGLPGLFRALPIDHQTLTLGIPVMVLATLLFIVSGISKRIHVYEGAMYIVIYFFFIGKLFDFI